jgi:hypothetical protein
MRDLSIVSLVGSRRNTFSTTSNLLFDQLQPIVTMKAAGDQFMVFAWDGSNSSTGVQLQQGVDDRVPIRVSRYGLDGMARSDDALRFDSDSFPIN